MIQTLVFFLDQGLVALWLERNDGFQPQMHSMTFNNIRELVYEPQVLPRDHVDNHSYCVLGLRPQVA